MPVLFESDIIAVSCVLPQLSAWIFQRPGRACDQVSPAPLETSPTAFRADTYCVCAGGTREGAK
jgi:hypothetical protein